MKLSFKFFCIAYIVVLLSTGFGGMIMIKNTNDTMWNTKMEQTNTAANYAAESFLAFTDVTYSEITEVQKKDIIRQIKATLDSSITDVEIHTSDTVKQEYKALGENEGMSHFIKGDDLILMESVCKLCSGTSEYFLFVYSDFTDIHNQNSFSWQIYGIVVFSISVISGLILFAVTQKITSPLRRLTALTDEIALGNYGKRVNIKSSDYEIAALSESFNSMSVAVQQRINEIKEESEKRNIFVADFTHEIKTPMTSIIGYSQMLNSYQLNEDERREAAEAILNEAKRLENLSLQLLDLYVLQNEKTQLENISLKEIGEKLKATLKHLSKKYNVGFSVDFADVNVSANEVLLLSLLYNLVDNAFKASSPGENVKIYSERNSGKVTIAVEDNGKGISEENIKFLTEPFFREDKSRSRKQGGAGLGLSICKEIAKLHGTNLCFKSELGKGTTVSFCLKGDNYA